MLLNGSFISKTFVIFSNKSIELEYPQYNNQARTDQIEYEDHRSQFGIIENGNLNFFCNDNFYIVKCNYT